MLVNYITKPLKDFVNGTYTIDGKEFFLGFVIPDYRSGFPVVYTDPVFNNFNILIIGPS